MGETVNAGKVMAERDKKKASDIMSNTEKGMIFLCLSQCDNWCHQNSIIRRVVQTNK